MLSSEVVHGIKALGLCSLLATSDVLSGWRFSKPYSMGYVLRVKGAAFIIRHNLNPKPKTVSNENEPCPFRTDNNPKGVSLGFNFRAR